MGRVWFRARSACPSPFPVPACVLGPGLSCAQPFLAGLSEFSFCAFFFFFLFFLFFCFFFWVFLSRALLSLSLPPLSFRLGWWLSFFFFLLVSVSLFPVGRCSWLGVAGFGWVVPLCLFPPPVFGAFWGGGLAASGGVGGRFGGCGLSSRLFPLPPQFCFLWGGGLACSSLCLPWAVAGTGLHSVLSSGLRFSVAFCLAAFRPHGSGGLCTRWARRPFLPG